VASQEFYVESLRRNEETHGGVSLGGTEKDALAGGVPRKRAVDAGM
jgi:hypothetical protein